MKFALINGERSEALKGAKGVCPSCGSELIAKCGEIKIHHWAHKGSRNCDAWWENETEWHRSWKNHFPIQWQEIIHFDDKGEKHIADVKTDEDWVIEIQHSYIKPDERRSRNTFYKKIVWVVDGLRRKRDKSQLIKVLEESTQAPVGNVNIRQVIFPEESKLIHEWLDSNVPVFFDINGTNKSKNSVLWFLLPIRVKGSAYLVPYSYKNFIELQINKGFDELAFEIIPNIRNIIATHEKRQSNRDLNSAFRRTRRNPYRRRF